MLKKIHDLRVVSGKGMRLVSATTSSAPFLSYLAIQLGMSLYNDKLLTIVTNYILQNRRSSFNWNMWSQPQPKELPTYPDDLDDTIAAYHALHLLGALQAADYARLTKTLIATEVKPGGPYRTWIVPPEADKVWLDVDPCVNAAVGAFACELGLELPGLTEYLLQCLQDDKLDSPYYPNRHVTLWQYSRISQLKNHELLRVEISKYLDSPTFPLLLAARNIGLPYTVSLDPNKPEALCYEYREKTIEDSVFNGCSAFSMAADHILHLPLPTDKEVTPQSNMVEKKDDNIALRKHATAYLRTLAKPHRQVSKKYFTAVLGQQGVTTAFADLVYSSLPKNKQKMISNKTLETLRFATLLGWVSYTMLDQAYDEGDRQLIPTGVFLNRAMRQKFEEACSKPEFLCWLDKTLATMDAANAQEIILNNQRKPLSLIELGQRALGHAAASMAILFICDIPTEDFATFALHYLVARQLDDDAHDWQKDRENKQLTPVGYWLSQHLGKNDDPAEIFWKQIIDLVASSVHEHTQISFQALQKMQDQIDISQLTNLLFSHDRAMQRALAKREETLEFTLALFSH